MQQTAIIDIPYNSSFGIALGAAALTYGLLNLEGPGELITRDGIKKVVVSAAKHAQWIIVSLVASSIISSCINPKSNLYFIPLKDIVSAVTFSSAYCMYKWPQLSFQTIQYELYTTHMSIIVLLLVGKKMGLEL